MKVKIKDKDFDIFLTDKEIETAVSTLAKKINTDYTDKDPLLVAVLNGSFIFCADLIRHLNFDPEISFTKLASYQGSESTGKVNELIGLTEDIKGRHILIVEDIIDTGNTLEKIIKILNEKEVASVEIVSLLFKSEVYKKKTPVRYFGLDIPNKFVIGYGLDYDGRGRSLRHIYQIAEG
ncbi:hypoxanthine phosphoribosyltransferase [Reichenbachiella sp. MALMAid0571]|uniref:hypoxanthine phosphoribosyltransferase n=1 Tax=Reichenbachiella sp. MALMAid0571 TaxID=3143939 RepID=UPI0032DFF731